MQKIHAIQSLGGSVASAARSIGISYQAVKKWPDVLSPRVSDRVHAAIMRQSRKPSVNRGLSTVVALDQKIKAVQA